jgi:pyoverdine/dityrosine biosynthesis protein Dit1
MDILNGVLLEEHKRLKKLGNLYNKKIKKLIRGSISLKPRRGKLYGYLAYWENKKVNFKYLGEISSKKVEKAKKQIKERKKYSLLLKKVKIDLKHISKTINGR